MWSLAVTSSLSPGQGMLFTQATARKQVGNVRDERNGRVVWNTVRDPATAAEAWTPPLTDYAGLRSADHVAHNHDRHGYAGTTAYSYNHDLAQPLFDMLNKMGVTTAYSEHQRELGLVLRKRIGCLNLRQAYHDRCSGVSRALGVGFYTPRQPFSASVRHKVIPSAGAFQTPQLLQLSGYPSRLIHPVLGGTRRESDSPSAQDHFIRIRHETRYHVTKDDVSSGKFSRGRLEEYGQTQGGKPSNYEFESAEPIYPRVRAMECVKSLQRPMHRPKAYLFRARLSNVPYTRYISLATLVMISTGTWGNS
ncbi:hypothetical protein HD554DRAFT_2037133 [Boletus coccyginus]|nr:hypothetical protein HD554DRAFT_2037133 [Boletus coccyginus]